MNKRQQESKKPSTVELKSYKLHYDCDCERFSCEDPRYYYYLFFPSNQSTTSFVYLFSISHF